MFKHLTPIALAALLSLALASPSLAKNSNGEAVINQALVAMAAGSNTVAGPGHYEAGGDGNRVIYRNLSVSPPDVCITLRNRGNNGRVKIEGSPDVPDEESLRPGLTISRCFEAPTEIRLKCGGNNASKCQAVWRIDAF